MTVRDLIYELEKCNDDDEVLVFRDAGDYLKLQSVVSCEPCEFESGKKFVGIEVFTEFKAQTEN